MTIIYAHLLHLRVAAKGSYVGTFSFLTCAIINNILMNVIAFLHNHLSLGRRSYFAGLCLEIFVQAYMARCLSRRQTDRVNRERVERLVRATDPRFPTRVTFATWYNVEA